MTTLVLHSFASHLFIVITALVVGGCIFAVGLSALNIGGQAVVGERVKKKETGKVTGIIGACKDLRSINSQSETAWAFTALIGFPLIGVLYDYTNLQIVFIVLLGLNVQDNISTSTLKFRF